jgi:hypothetical protein
VKGQAILLLGSDCLVTLLYGEQRFTLPSDWCNEMQIKPASSSGFDDAADLQG